MWLMLNGTFAFVCVHDHYHGKQFFCALHSNVIKVSFYILEKVVNFVITEQANYDVITKLRLKSPTDMNTLLTQNQ